MVARLAGSVRVALVMGLEERALGASAKVLAVEVTAATSASPSPSCLALCARTSAAAKRAMSAL